MTWMQKQITLPPKRRGFHLITRKAEAALPELGDYAVGVAHVFIQHSSASLTLNENADPTVRQDFESLFNRAGTHPLRRAPEQLNTLSPDSRQVGVVQHRHNGEDGRL